MSKRSATLLAWAVTSKSQGGRIADAILEVGTAWATGQSKAVIPGILERHGITEEEYDRAVEELKKYGAERYGIK